MRVIGLDPGLRRTGWGVVETSGSRVRHVADGICCSRGDDLATRLLSLHGQLGDVIAAYEPDQAAVEHTFVNKDPAGTLKLGQARAIALLVPAQRGLPVAEYAPNAVKKAVVGVGHADKTQVEHRVRLALPGAAPSGADAADALAVALCHIWQARAGSKLQAALAAAEGAGPARRRRADAG
ncbi:MAG: crossover junction endodeoxyribonuclease RuvC [Pseudomonadota bacterium]